MTRKKPKLTKISMQCRPKNLMPTAQINLNSHISIVGVVLHHLTLFTLALKLESNSMVEGFKFLWMMGGMQSSFKHCNPLIKILNII